MKPQLIVYATPVGQLADQLALYFQSVQTHVGVNAAHDYMPHCTLTGFFNDELTAVPLYLQALDQALINALPTRPEPAITIVDLKFQPTFHYLELESAWIKRLIAEFASAVHSPTCQSALRLKDWLHLSLAYEFPPSQQAVLVQLAKSLVDPHVDVQWELCFYERRLDGSWICHQSRSLSVQISPF